MADSSFPKPDPVTMAVMRACETMWESRLVTTIPVGELLQFARALLDAYGVLGNEGGQGNG